MNAIAFILCLLVIVVTAIYLYKKLNPQGILILSGLFMLSIAFMMDIQPIVPTKPTGGIIFDLVKIIEETFLSNLDRAGLMIMTVGGYVAFMNYIQATNALVYISM